MKLIINWIDEKRLNYYKKKLINFPKNYDKTREITITTWNLFMLFNNMQYIEYVIKK